MTTVLALNPGSSSLKATWFDGDDPVTAIRVDGWDGRTVPPEVLWQRPDLVAIRFVHGGERTEPAVLDDAVTVELAALAPLAPLHQPPALRLAAAVRQRWPETAAVACFDSAFHSGLPPRARLCALPRGLAAEHGIRRFGFHGLSLAHATRRAAELLRRPVEHTGIIVAHLGAGTSVTAVEGGVSVDTSMGFSPSEGLPGRTRSGSLDPAVLFHLLRRGMSPGDLERTLTTRSGLAGLSGTDGDTRSLLADPSRDAAEAVDLYLHRVRREIAAARASLTRFDALVLTGGVADHNPDLRARVVAGLRFLGVAGGPEHTDADDVVTAGAPPVFAVRTREDRELARQARHATRDRSLR
ncbi:acetate kinase [Actinokineospora guangxiensis]|uniref:Acetate kinase n=1 Tax=Actinokineospora guangxiensis TaxID=1490288 RepID=A0ABW0EIE9_9PSEU